MGQYELIRTFKRVYGKSIRGIQRETGHHRQTIRKALDGKEPKYRRKQPPRCPVMDPVAQRVERWLLEDQQRPKKQRHTAHRIWVRLVEEEGFQGAESTVRRWVREKKAALGLGGREAVVPLDPEVAREAEVDWGTAWVEMGGRPRTVKLFVMRSRYSGKPFIRAYACERQEMLLDAHLHAFAFYGGVFEQIVYDNLTSAVSRILRGSRRIEQDRFVSFRSHYTFRARFCNPGRGQEKGGVEGLIGFARRNFLVPLPKVRSFEELNAWLLKRCLEYGQHRIRGRQDPRTVNERFETEASRLLALPEQPFSNVKLLRVKVDRYQTVRVDRNRYSVSRTCVGRWIWAQVGCEQIRLFADDRLVGEHQRRFSDGHWQLDPLHYLDLIQQRPRAFERARPILAWRQTWPPEYETLLGRLRHSRGENSGTQEFVQILRLHESYATEAIQAAVRTVLQRHCAGYHAIYQLLEHSQKGTLETRPLPPQLIPGVTDRQVATSDVSRFDALLGGRS